MTVIAVLPDPQRTTAAHWALRLAQRSRQPLLVLSNALDGCGPGSQMHSELFDPSRVPESFQALLEAGARSSLAAPAAESLSSDDPVPAVRIDVVASSDLMDSALRAVTKESATYLVVAVAAQRRRDGSSVPRQLLARCPCPTILLRGGGPSGGGPTNATADHPPAPRVLVPIVHGTDHRAALRLAAQLTAPDSDGDSELASGGGSEIGSEMGSEAGPDAAPQTRPTALSVEPRALLDAEGVGRRLIQRALDDAEVDSSRFRPQVLIDDDHRGAIARCAEQADLVLLGAPLAQAAPLPGLGGLRAQVLGLIPERLMQRSPPVQVAMVRGAWSSTVRLQHLVDRWLTMLVPQLQREHRISLSERLQSGSEWNFDFVALITLSTAIAALGLVQSSTAVVIGAMLVAPLMTPILGAGLALVQGNLPLLRSASRALVLGYLSALTVGLLVGAGFGQTELTPELLARGNPTLLDLAVAFLSGIAAAYCLGRPGLGAALPGVAIAAALVPPIATTGIAAASGHRDVALGSALLFATNVAAIVVGAFVALYAIGLRSHVTSGLNRPWVRGGLVTALAGLALLSWPLALATLRQLAPEPPGPGASPELRRICQAVLDHSDSEPPVEVLSVIGREGEEIVIRVSAPGLPPTMERRVAQAVARHLDREVLVRFESWTPASPAPAQEAASAPALSP